MEKKEDNTVFISCEVNEIFASTEVTQYFTNELENPIELKILFPINKKLSLSKFIVSMDEKNIISKVMSKEKAEEKYVDTIASGNVGFKSSYEDENKSYSVNIGNLAPKKQVKLQTNFIQMVDNKDLSYEFNIIENYPAFYYDGAKINFSENNNKKLETKIKIETQSKITRLIPMYVNDEIKKNSEYNVKYSPDYKKAEIEYKNNKPNLDKNEPKNEDEDNNFRILFRTENMNKPFIYSQFNPILKETAYSINYTYISKYLKEIPVPEKPDEDNTISYVLKYEKNEINETPGLFVFLIDQSGSMSGRPMELVRKALLLFIQSLPENSYFQLIGFGSEFKKYNEEPVIYNKENVDNIIKIINELTADLGGTNISKPLAEIFNSESYSKIDLSKNIFLLTDGEVFDREKCIELISNNSSKFRVHALGIGNSFDEVLIKQCGKLGKGSSSFVKELEKINSVVIDTLNKGLRPYITDLKFEFENYKDEISKNIIAVNPINNFVYQNEIMNYSFILPDNKELSNLKIKITGKDPINLIENDATFENIIKLKDGEEMSKMIVGKGLKYNDDLIKDTEKEIKFAKKYQILSKNTALFAEIENEENQQSKLIKVDLVNITPPKIKNSYNRLNNLTYSASIGSSMMNFMPPMAPTCGIFNPPCCGFSNNINQGFGGMGGMCGMGSNFMNNNMFMSNNMNNMNNNMMGMGMAMMNNNMNCMNNNMNNMMGMGMMQMQNNMNMGMMHNMNNMNMAMMNQNLCVNAQMCPPPSPPTPPKSKTSDYLSSERINYSESSNKKANNNIKRENNEHADMNLILSQDIIEGFWNENNETKKLINIITLEKFDKIKNKIIALNKGENESKIIYTILVIYYLKTKCTTNLNEYKLVINKANKFLQKNGINYDDIVSDI